MALSFSTTWRQKALLCRALALLRHPIATWIRTRTVTKSEYLQSLLHKAKSNALLSTNMKKALQENAFGAGEDIIKLMVTNRRGYSAIGSRGTPPCIL
ncbi:hypothetical protein BDR07DRAFT_213419 [Suillus spraguei]|nr:hypothetical protein BDR07DRAFT_213419 [Suillus spraguei]